MKIISADHFRKIATGSAFFALVSSSAFAQDQNPGMAPDTPPNVAVSPSQQPGMLDPSAPQIGRPSAPPPRPPRGRRRGRADDGPGLTGRKPDVPIQVHGTVSRYLLNAFGEADGLLFANRMQVHFSPQMSAMLTTTIKSGDVVVTSGNQESDVVFRADSITNTSSGAMALVTNPHKREGRSELPLEIRGAQLQRLERSGRISFILYGPRGEVRGAILEDGSQFVIAGRPAGTGQYVLQAGAKVEVKGFGTSNAYGTCLEPTEISIDGSPAIDLYGIR
jgi:hypothetical protein